MMTEEMIRIVCFTGAGVCAAIVAAMTVLWDMPPWRQIRLYAGRRAASVRISETRVRQLEEWADQWTELRMAGIDPVWVDAFGWVENDGRCRHGQLIIRCATCAMRHSIEVPAEYIAPCVCGYTTECAFHCGSGHETDLCPGAHSAKVSGRAPFGHPVNWSGAPEKVWERVWVTHER